MTNLFTEPTSTAPTTLNDALRRWVFRWVPRVQQEAAQRELDELLKAHR